MNGTRAAALAERLKRFKMRELEQILERAHSTFRLAKSTISRRNAMRELETIRAEFERRGVSLPPIQEAR